MNKIKILLDSTCDLDMDLLKRFDLDYIKMGVTMDDKEYSASLSWEEYTPKEFYDFMRSGKRCYTNQVKESAFEETFTALLEEGYDIVYIGCSSGLSGSVALGKLVAERLKEKYKDNTIAIVDPLCSGMAQGSSVMPAKARKRLPLSSPPRDSTTISGPPLAPLPI